MHKSTSVAGLTCLFALSAFCHAADFQSGWPEDVTRTWVGPEYWANRLQDWRIAEGRLECVAAGPMRTVHLLTRRLGKRPGELRMSVRLGRIGEQETPSGASFAGFLIGAGPDVDYRAAALCHHSPGEGGGLIAAIDGKGKVFFRDNTKSARIEKRPQAKPRATAGLPKEVELRLRGAPEGEGYRLTLSSHDPETGKQLGRATLAPVPGWQLIGNVALCSNSPPSLRNNYWFRDWQLAGSKVDVHEDRRFGPVLCAQHTLSNNVLKLTAQMGPLGEQDTQTARLEVRDGEAWKRVAEGKLIAPGWTIPFRVQNWDSTKDTPYRIVYQLRRADGTFQEYTYAGTVRRDPLEKRTIVVAGFTGNHNCRGGVERSGFPWTRDGLWFPHADLTGHVEAHRPDVLVFTGDQVYEGASPTRPERGETIILDYLYKWYLWCWAYRDLCRDVPSICIPDDHDVYQGNLWGAGGRKTDKDDKGGYVHPAEFVKAVERTQTSHLPDPYDPTPVEQGIAAYYCPMVYGRIGFAVIEDRKFKSGPNGLCPPTGGRADHVRDPNFDPKTADVPGAKLLGDRQLKFLRQWAADWGGTDMKVVVSQTVFAGMATHHGGGLMRLVIDYDSNGWPQTGRNKALHEFRRGFAFMIGGDQHLATIVHHGIETFNDAGWSMAVPSVANFYPRAWRPEKPGRNRKPGMPDYCGEHLDGLGNHVTVYAATNPGESTGHTPAALHDRMPGYGIVKFDKQDRTIAIECWPRYADPADPKAEQYLGWPLVIKQEDNYGRKAAAYLPTLKCVGMTDPVVQIIEEADGEVVYTIRAKGTSFRPKVFGQGSYTIRVGEPGTAEMKELKGVRAVAPESAETLEVRF